MDTHLEMMHSAFLTKSSNGSLYTVCNLLQVSDLQINLQLKTGDVLGKRHTLWCTQAPVM